MGTFTPTVLMTIRPCPYSFEWRSLALNWRAGRIVVFSPLLHHRPGNTTAGSGIFSKAAHMAVGRHRENRNGETGRKQHFSCESSTIPCGSSYDILCGTPLALGNASLSRLGPCTLTEGACTGGSGPMIFKQFVLKSLGHASYLERVAELTGLHSLGVSLF